MKLKFGQWLPDLPDFENSGAITAKNVIPDATAYRSLRGLKAFSDALDGPAIAALWGRDSSGIIFNFAADGTKLYRLDNSTTWTDVSKAGGYSAQTWDLNAFGNRALAATPSVPIQYYDLGVSTEFADLPNAPSAKQVCVVRDFIIAGFVNDDPLKVQWSGLNNSEQWTSSGATQSGSQSLNGRGGQIKRIIGGDDGYIFQERAVTRMRYVGPPVIFRFDEIEAARGTPASGSVVHIGARVYYYSSDGFYMINAFGGSDSIPIGNDRVNQWFKEEAEPGEVTNMRSSIDRNNALIVWAFRSTSSITHFDRLLIYSWKSDRWAYAEVDVEVLAEYVAPGLTLDQLDGPLPGGIDADSIIVDDEVFAGGAINLLAFNTSHEGCTFGGDILEYCLDTGEFSQDDRLLFVNSVRPLVELKSSGDVFVTPITRDQLIDNPAIGAAVMPNDIGTCDLRVHARYHRYRITGTADLGHGVGVEFTPKTVGRR